MSRKRIVIDTNVYLSALLFGGNTRFLLEKSIYDGHVICVSEEIYTEMRKVVTRKFSGFLTEYQAFEVVLRENTILIPLGTSAVSVCRDPKDNIIIETAVSGGCDLIITGDKDLLMLSAYDGILIFDPKTTIDSGILG